MKNVGLFFVADPTAAHPLRMDCFATLAMTWRPVRHCERRRREAIQCAACRCWVCRRHIRLRRMCVKKTHWTRFLRLSNPKKSPFSLLSKKNSKKVVFFEFWRYNVSIELEGWKPRNSG